MGHHAAEELPEFLKTQTTDLERAVADLRDLAKGDDNDPDVQRARRMLAVYDREKGQKTSASAQPEYRSQHAAMLDRVMGTRSISGAARNDGSRLVLPSPVKGLA